MPIQNNYPDLHLWIALNSIENLGTHTFKKLLGTFGSITTIFSASYEELSKLNLKDSIKADILNGPDIDLCQKEIDLANKHSIQIIPLHSSDYPINLRNSPYACPILYVKGELLPEDTHSIAMVGTRKASDYGKNAAEFFVSEMAASALTVISGLALGIDRICHRKCIQIKHRTIAVLGQGHLDITDSVTLEYIDRICQNGAVISQFPLRFPGSKMTFPVRNHVISGLSKGTLVIESKKKGGALITAHACLEEGKEVMAVPGSMFSTTSFGCNALIAKGAHPVFSSEQIHSILSYTNRKPTQLPPQSLTTPTKSSPTPKRPPLQEDEQRLLKHMPNDKIQIESLSQQSNIPVSQVLAILTTLELKSYVTSYAGMTYKKLI